MLYVHVIPYDYNIFSKYTSWLSCVVSSPLVCDSLRSFPLRLAPSRFPRDAAVCLTCSRCSSAIFSPLPHNIDLRYWRRRSHNSILSQILKKHFYKRQCFRWVSLEWWEFMNLLTCFFWSMVDFAYFQLSELRYFSQKRLRPRGVKFPHVASPHRLRAPDVAWAEGQEMGTDTWNEWMG